MTNEEWVPPEVFIGEIVQFWRLGITTGGEPSLMLVTATWGHGSIGGVLFEPKSPPRTLVDVCYHDSDPMKAKHLRIAESDVHRGTWTHFAWREAFWRLIDREMIAMAEETAKAKRPKKADKTAES